MHLWHKSRNGTIERNEGLKGGKGGKRKRWEGSETGGLIQKTLVSKGFLRTHACTMKAHQ